MHSILKKLHIDETNPGACTGPGGWISDANGKELVSYNPTTGEPLARIIQASPHTYEKIASTAYQTFHTWRELPAPRRGELIRDLGNALRQLKEPLGDLVTL
jgi:aldehyde dehydrogenase (NAD+)